MQSVEVAVVAERHEACGGVIELSRYCSCAGIGRAQRDCARVRRLLGGGGGGGGDGLDVRVKVEGLVHDAHVALGHGEAGDAGLDVDHDVAELDVDGVGADRVKLGGEGRAAAVDEDGRVGVGGGVVEDEGQRVADDGRGEHAGGHCHAPEAAPEPSTDAAAAEPSTDAAEAAAEAAGAAAGGAQREAE